MPSGGAYNLEDFGKYCTITECVDATSQHNNDPGSVPGLDAKINPEKCELNNQPTWSGDVCLIQEVPTGEYVPVCIQNQTNTLECACITGSGFIIVRAQGMCGPA